MAGRKVICRARQLEENPAGSQHIKLRTLGVIATTLMLIGAIGSRIIGFQTLFNLYQLALVAGILTILAWRENK